MFTLDLVVHPLSEESIDYFENRPNIFVSGAEIVNIIDEHATLLGKKSTVSTEHVNALPQMTLKINVIHHDGRELPMVYGVKYTPRETKLADLATDLFSLVGLPQTPEQFIWGWCNFNTNRTRFGGFLPSEMTVPETGSGYELTAWRVPISDSYHMFECVLHGLTSPVPPIFLPRRDPVAMIFALRPFVKPPAIADTLFDDAVIIPNPNPLVPGTEWTKSSVFLGEDWRIDSFVSSFTSHPSASPRTLLPEWKHEGRRRHYMRLASETSAEWIRQALCRCSNQSHNFKISVADSITLRLEIHVPTRHSIIIPRMNELNTERWDIATYIAEKFPYTRNYISKLLSLVKMDEHAPAAEQPSSIKIPLKHHQLQNLHRMLHIEKETNLATTIYTQCNDTTWIDPRTNRLCDVSALLNVSGGFLSDTVGLGKTLSVIALCLEHPPPRGAQNTLILCPPSILIQWKAEIEKYSSLRVLEYHGKRKQGVTRDTFPAYDIILTTYSTYMKNEIFTTPPQIPWHRVVYDEAHTMSERYASNPNIIEARNRWCVTATPLNNIDRQFKALGIPMRLRDPGFATLYYILDPLMIRHTQTAQTTQLPGITHENVAVSFQTEGERELYEKALAYVKNDVRGSQTTDILRLHSHMTTLRRICTAGSWSFETLFSAYQEQSLAVDYTLVAPHEEDDICPICMNIYEQPSITTCNHWFCTDCIATALTFPPGNCPMCRHPQTIRDLRAGVLFGQTPEIVDNMETDDAFIECSSKLNHLLAMLETFDTQDKSLIFCESSTTIPFIMSALKAKGFKARCIHGSMAAIQRGNAIRAFQEDPHTKVFVSSLRSAAAGINLTAANHIFFLGPVMNGANYTQAVGRAHRTGQLRDVTVHQLYMQGTLENELILHRNRHDTWNFDALRSLFV